MYNMTAVEWIEIELKKKGFDFPYVTLKIEQAKAMEREQIIKAFCEGYDHDGDNYDGAEISYYNKTYKGGEQ
jgi:hypothetical protein